MKKKIILAISLVFLFVIIGLIVYFKQIYMNSEKYMTKLYYNEIKDVLKIENKDKLIKVIKNDFNCDDTLDYICLLGQVNENKQEVSDKFTTNLDFYSKVTLVYIQGIDKQMSKIIIDKTFTQDIGVIVEQNNEDKYIVIKGNGSGNISIVMLKDNNLEDIIDTNFSNVFNGYTLNISFDNETKDKIKVSLDNYGRSYLPENKQIYELNFENEKMSNENYRITYTASRFCDFSIVTTEQGIQLNGKQYLLYLNSNDKNLPKTIGVANTIFSISGDKITFEKVEIQK